MIIAMTKNMIVRIGKSDAHFVMKVWWNIW